MTLKHHYGHECVLVEVDRPEWCIPKVGPVASTETEEMTMDTVTVEMETVTMNNEMMFYTEGSWWKLRFGCADRSVHIIYMFNKVDGDS